MEGPLGEYTGYYTPGFPKPIARLTAITHRNDAFFQALLTGVSPAENRILKQLPFEASSGGAQFYIVFSMPPRFAGEACAAILDAMTTNLRQDGHRRWPAGWTARPKPPVRIRP